MNSCVSGISRLIILEGYMSQNDQLQQSVLAELRWEPSVTASHIGVTANAGVVSLTGHVDSFAEKLAAETAARRVKGVKAVVEEIEVRLPFDATRTNEDIAAAVIERLAWDVSVPSDAVKVKVEGGWVTLSGEVKWQFQRLAVAEDAYRLSGVRGVSNQITIRPQVDASVLSDEITHALHRSWFFDPLTVTVSAEGGTVHLGGTVQTLHERQVAGATAWSAPGVVDVINDIEIAG
jgi:osmotically-inducible protein OsmY